MYLNKLFPYNFIFINKKGLLRLSDILEKDSSLEIDGIPHSNVDNTYRQNIKSKTDKLKDEISDIKSDVKNMQKDLENLDLEVEDDVSRMGYVRQLTGEFLEYLFTLNNELSSQVEIPQSDELMSKIIGRSERKRYYMSKFRL